jgi:UDP-glucose 6-dehydrogenase
MKLSVVGTGYVGLVTGACCAAPGDDVVRLDVDERKVAGLREGSMPIYDPGFGELVERNAGAGRLRFTTDAAEAARHGRVQFIAVGTPQGEDGSADVEHVFDSARQIGRHMDGEGLVVNKSTVPVGTATAVAAAIAEELRVRGSALRCSVVSNPEFLKEGSPIDNFLRPDRIIVGSDDPDSTDAQQKRVLVAKIEARFGSDLAGMTFAVWGLSFKAGTDDIHEAPSAVVIAELAKRGARVRAYDPVAMNAARRAHGATVGLEFAPSAFAALADADALVIVTEWKEFRSPELEAMRVAMRRPVIFDGRNILDPARARAADFEYTGIGRP